MAEGIRRNLDGRAVTARRGTWLYRTRLFLRRYRWGVAAATMAMLAAASMTTLHVSRITHERDRAQAATARAEAVSAIGRASCRGRVCQSVEISVVAGSLKKKTKNNNVCNTI